MDYANDHPDVYDMLVKEQCTDQQQMEARTEITKVYTLARLVPVHVCSLHKPTMAPDKMCALTLCTGAEI